jgi:hypothetical protein
MSSRRGKRPAPSDGDGAASSSPASRRSNTRARHNRGGPSAAQAEAPSRRPEERREITFIKLDDVESEELQDKFFCLRGFLISLDYRKECNVEKMYGKIQKAVTASPELSRIVTHDGKSLLTILLEKVNLANKKVVGAFTETAKFLINANPWALLKSIDDEDDNVKIIEALAKYNDFSVILYPWIGQNYAWIFNLPQVRRRPPHFHLAHSCHDSGTIKSFYEAFPQGLQQRDSHGFYPLHVLIDQSSASQLSAKHDLIKWMAMQHPAAIAATTNTSISTPFSMACEILLDYCDTSGEMAPFLGRAILSTSILQQTSKICLLLLREDRVILQDARSLLRNRISRHCNLEPVQDLAINILRYSYHDPKTRISSSSLESMRRRFPFLPSINPLITSEGAIAEERVKIKRTALLFNKHADSGRASRELQDVNESYKRWALERLRTKVEDTKRVKEIRSELATMKVACQVRRTNRRQAGRNRGDDDDDDDDDIDIGPGLVPLPFGVPMRQLIMQRIINDMFQGPGDDDDFDY